MHLHTHEKHEAEAKGRIVRVALITASSSRFEELSKGRAVVDDSGDVLEEMVKKEGHRVVSRALVSDDTEMIRSRIIKALYDEGAEAVIISGGTGLTKRDVTLEAVRPLLDKVMDGFGEIFRMVSYQQIGASAYLSRALAGTVGGRLIFCLPGSPEAARLGMELVLSGLTHAIHMASH